MSDFMLPDIGEGIVECEVVEWRVSEGDEIAEDQPVVEVMTDKALVEITAPEAGRVTKLYVAKGDIAKVHAPLFAYEAHGEEGESTETLDPPRPAAGEDDEVASPAAEAPGPRQSSAEARPTAAVPARDFILPDIGEGIVECEVVEWRVAEGEAIEEDQPLVDVMTDKALVEITAPEAGTVSKLYVPKGDIAKVHAPLFAYVPAHAEEGEETVTAEVSDAEPGVPQTPGRKEGVMPVASGGRGPYGRIPASPAVRRLVREHGLSLESIDGSGKDGRVLKEDVLRYLDRQLEHGQVEGGEARPARAVTSFARSEIPQQGTAASKPEEGEVRVEPIRGVRAVMARRMVESASTIPHFHYGEEIDVTELLALRERLKPVAEAQQVRLTLMPFFMKALALAVRKEPILNARLNAEVTEIHYLPSVNVGMAVDSRSGLIVPNVKQVERRSVLEVAREIQRLTADAREGRVAQEDLKGGTISISNIGAFGGTYAAPIINAPELAIVAIGKSQWLPRFDARGEVVKRAIMTVTWAGDHRVIDGGTIARFCNAWKGYLESPETMLLHLG
ncbi:dihydrolipoyllysine-residue acetyltransferase [Billgrantia tianxiuensis]|jgi:2-oxoisovalerate dehydrogenase E2 component (dihydrolipoyl transacylase)|uniref:Dihydrolipoamide acetyltransferase component of pyruvate dehydrogenase complex n=1 Tax=Billgrantia tianxiuensis TaxID=2497861 RepID=A0A6I6SKL6_9GAMM|nr:MULTISPECIES: dihydrolipoyllysine-residue acetyltransferase [Halomonas]MCE8031808.1 dihydrolipoyllysine-residue acetyltransferase [Halomonas sp. MCCC 1A11057]QHC50092.1 dihydrolipoyllysine-residue acetyltransferase [Halomonas tianxiuensis]